MGSHNNKNAIEQHLDLYCKGVILFCSNGSIRGNKKKKKKKGSAKSRIWLRWWHDCMMRILSFQVRMNQVCAIRLTKWLATVKKNCLIFNTHINTHNDRFVNIKLLFGILLVTRCHKHIYVESMNTWNRKIAAPQKCTRKQCIKWNYIFSSKPDSQRHMWSHNEMATKWAHI